MNKTRTVSILVLLTCSCLWAQDFQILSDTALEPATTDSLQVAGVWGGRPHCAAIDGTTAYVGLGDKVVIYDIANPADPTELGQTTSLGGKILDIEASGTTAWVAMGVDGVTGIDISTPSSPVVISTIPDLQDARAITIDNSHLYIADYEAGIILYDIQSPGSPVYLSDRYASSPRDVVVDNGIVYTGGRSIYVLDFTTPTDPDYITSFLAPDQVHAIDLQNNILAAACEDTGLVLYDATTPSAVTELSTLDTDGITRDVILDGTSAYIADDTNGVLGIDITDPQNPQYAGGIFSATQPITSICLTPSVMIAIHEYTGFYAFEYPAAYDLFPVSEVNYSHTLRDLQYDDGYVYVSAGEEGFFVFDANDPANMTPAAISPNESNWHLNEISVDGGLAFSLKLRDAQSFYTTWIDVSDPLNPQAPQSGMMMSFPQANPKPFHVYDGDLLISYTNNILDYLRYTPPGISTLGDLSLGGPAIDIDVAWPYAYIANGTAGLQIVDFTDPENMTLVGSLSIPDARRVRIENRYAYVQSGDSDVVIVDILDPTYPVQIAQHTLCNLITDIFARGRLLFVACDHSFRAYDVSIPWDLEYLSGLNLELTINAISANGHNAWASLVDNSMVAIQLPDSWNDCNGNNIPDEEDIANGTSEDCNQTGIPDECEQPYGIVLDCNTNGIWDSCDLDSGFSRDINHNRIPDECEASDRIILVDDDAPAGGDGRTWATAFRHLQDALAVASSNDQVWVAAGTYKPVESESGILSNNDRELSFYLRDRITLLGGFEGTEDTSSFNPSDRNIATNVTTLSGDLEGNDDDNLESLSENTVHVVKAIQVQSMSRFDGFTVIGGNAEDNYPPNNNILGRNNLGGGLLIDSSTQIIVANSTFTHNTARWGAGSGCIQSDDIDFVNCIFHKNINAALGSGLQSYQSQCTINDSLFYNNQARHRGAAMSFWSAAEGTSISNCTIACNRINGSNPYDGSGGGLYNFESVLDINNSIIWHNLAPNSPNILSLYSTVTASYSDIESEMPSGNGNTSNDPLFINPWVYDFRLRPNSPAIDAGDNALVALDTADLDGDGNTTEPTPYDVVLNPRRVDDIFTDDTGSGTAPIVDMGAIEVQGWSPEDCNSNGIPDEAEVLTHEGTDCNENGILDECDIRDGTSLDEDQSGYPDECQAIWYVDQAAEPGGDGLSWENAFVTIGEGVEAAYSGDEIIVADGTYTGEGNVDLVIEDKALWLHSLNGRDHCTIDGQRYEGQNHRFVSIINNPYPNCRIEGFRIYNFRAPEEQSSGTGTVGHGGAIYCSESSPHISHCSITHSYALISGGVLYAVSASPVIEDCYFSDNSAGETGGALSFEASSPVMNRCEFRESNADNGGAIHAANSTLSLQNSHLYYNVSQYGAAIFLTESEADIVQSIIERNHADYQAGGVYNHQSETHIANTVLYGNNALNACQIFNNSEYGLTIVNSICWQPQNSSCTNNIRDLSDTITVSWSCIWGSWEGEGNLSNNPMFVDPSDADFRLAANSPLIDAGNNTLTAEWLTTDFAGHPRYADDPLTLDIGVGEAPIIDMGAHEFADCNGNGIIDDQDILDGTSTDCNSNLVPDECEEDCNANGIPDDCDIQSGFSLDENEDGVPDECLGIYYVNASAPASGNGLTWGTAFRCLNDALAVASQYSQIWVAAGTYRPDESDYGHTTPGDRYAAFALPSGVHIYGGFTGTETSITERDPHLNLTILSGDLADNDDGSLNQEENAYHVLTAELVFDTIELDGFIIEGGYADGPVVNMNFRYRSGAGLFTENMQQPLQISNCIFRRNFALNSGSAICNWNYSKVTVLNTLFTDHHSSVSVIQNQQHCQLDVINCTFTSNTSTYSLGAAINGSAGETTAVNSIFYDNTSNNGNQLIDVVATYCLVEGGYEGIGNIDEDPLFTNPSAGDYTLQASSPCVDTGDSTALPTWLTLDLLGNLRVIGTAVDMGAYEYVMELTPGDADYDGDVDLADFARFQACFGSDSQECLGIFDLDDDDDIDLDDFSTFADQITGPLL